MTTGKTIALTRWTFVGKVMSLLFNMLSRLVMEKAMASHSSTFAWRIPWMEEPGGLPSTGSHRAGHDWSDAAAAAAAHWKVVLTFLLHWIRHTEVQTAEFPTIMNTLVRRLLSDVTAAHGSPSIELSRVRVRRRPLSETSRIVEESDFIDDILLMMIFYSSQTFSINFRCLKYWIKCKV